MFERVDAWLDDGFFRNLGEDISLDDYSDWKSMQGNAGIRRQQQEAQRAAIEKEEREQFTMQWDYSRDCPDGDQSEGMAGTTGANYKPQCDPSKPEYIGKNQSDYGYSARLPNTSVPDSWYERLSEPGSSMLGYFQTGGDGFFQPKTISKANILSELIEEDPDRIKEEIELVYQSLNSDFESTVIDSLDVIVDGAHQLDAQCDPFKLMHLMIVTKFARYLTLEDITLKYSKWHVLVDAVSSGALLAKWDHLTWGVELYQAGTTVMSEVPKWASMNAEFKALESQICSDSKSALIFISNFLDMIEYMSTQSEHGFDGNYITEGSSESVDPRFPGEVGYFSPGDIANNLKEAADLIELGLHQIDDEKIDPNLIEGFNSWADEFEN